MIEEEIKKLPFYNELPPSSKMALMHLVTVAFDEGAKRAVEYIRHQMDTSDRVLRPLKTELKDRFWYDVSSTVFDSILEGALEAKKP